MTGPAGPAAPMTLGLMSAMHEELSAVLSRFDGQPERVAGREFWRGHWNGQPVVAVLSRIGKVAAATTATTLIQHFGVRQVVFTGVAGGIGPGVRVGDVVVARDFLQHDMDASPLFPRHEVPLYGRSRFEADTRLTERLTRASTSALQALARRWPTGWAGLDLTQARVHQGLILSGDRFIGQSHDSAELRTRLPDALAVEMEGAALAQVCHDHGVPMAAVRIISDRADSAAHVDFLRFIQEMASAFSADVLSALLEGGPLT